MRSRSPLLCLLALLGCGQVDLDAIPVAKALCENPTDYLRQPSARMLPGRACLSCHVEGGQASRFVWNAGGTVYDRIGSGCNEGGVEGVLVELIDSDGAIVAMLTTNRSGNFFTADPIGTKPIRARITRNGKLKEMMQLQMPPVNCATCHNPEGPAGGRIYLN
jgi:hypothetical protein